jgi:hypothetical protein
LDLVLQNSPLLQVKIAYWLLLRPHLLRYAMQPANQRSYTVAKAISVSVSLLLNVYLVYATLFQLAHRSQCRPVLLRKFYWLGKIPKRFIADLRTRDLPPPTYLPIVAAGGRNPLANVKLVLHPLARQLKALMEKLLPPFRSLALSSV